MKNKIQEQLSKIEGDRNVLILFAAESGSRAWGFHSEDSDYDVRFVYAHTRNWYLALNSETKRDVIAVADGSVDLVGWDIRKALRLCLKGNASVMEWLKCPQYFEPSYMNYPKMVAAVAESSADLNLSSIWYHYQNLARNNWKKYIDGNKSVRLKKYLYVMRELLAAEYIADVKQFPPILIDDLIDACSNSDVYREMRSLIAAKRSGELLEGPRIPALDTYVETQLTADAPVFAIPSKESLTALQKMADNTFIGIAPKY